MFVITTTVKHVDDDGEVDRPYATLTHFLEDMVVEMAGIPLLPYVIQHPREVPGDQW